MNYIREIKSFNLWLDYNQVPKNAIALWYALMAINNFTHWKKEFTVSIHTLVVRTGFSPREIYRARAILQESGRITYSERNGRKCSVYSMSSFEESDIEFNNSRCDNVYPSDFAVRDEETENWDKNKCEENNFLDRKDCNSNIHTNDTQMVTQTVTQTVTQMSTLINNTKTKQNKTSLRNDDKSSFVIKSFDDGSQPIKIPEKKNLIFEISPTQNPEITQITTKQDEDLARGAAERNAGRFPVKSVKELCKRFIEEYNRKCARMPQATVLTDFRKKGIMNRYKDFGEDGFINMLEKASSSDFLNGQSGSGWKANFDWLIRPTNFIKVIEGNYDNEKQSLYSRHKEGRNRPSHFTLIREAYEDVLEMNDIKIDFNPIGIWKVQN